MSVIKMGRKNDDRMIIETDLQHSKSKKDKDDHESNRAKKRKHIKKHRKKKKSNRRDCSTSSNDNMIILILLLVMKDIFVLDSSHSNLEFGHNQSCSTVPRA